MQKKTINELEKKLTQRDLDNENKLINEIKELKEYKEKYEELLKEKKHEEISANMPPLETEEQAAENIADINERRNNTRKKEE